jgi:glycogen operon protein
LFLVGHYNEELGVKDVTWLAPEGTEMSIEQWEDRNGRSLGILLDGRARVSGVQRAGADATLLITVNAQHDNVDFTLPEVPEGTGWVCMFDTFDPDYKNRKALDFNTTYGLNGRSMALFELVKEQEA